MSCAQSIFCPHKGLTLVGPSARNGRSLPSLPWISLHTSCLKASLSQLPWPSKLGPRLVYTAPKYQRFAPVYAFGGKGKGENEPFSWESLKKAMGGSQREPSMGDFLREQMRREGSNGNGGDKGFRGGGGGDGSGDPEDEGLAGTFDELQQVILAVLGVVVLYIFMIHGEELTRLARDYIRFLFRGKTSVRLRRAMLRWQKFSESIVRKEVVREDWLERAIVATPTWWHNPRQLAAMFGYHVNQEESYSKPKGYNNDDDKYQFDDTSYYNDQDDEEI